MIKIAHIYASNAKVNSGDFFLGISTKKYFQEKYFKEKNVSFTDIDCRNQNNFINIDNINKNYDYLLIGGGGLILPDTTPNNISCWQWVISLENLQKINIPIYVVSIGYNLFFTQKITNPNRENNEDIPERLNIFKNHIKTLINKSTSFTMRHNGDISMLKEIIGENNNIKFEFCPVNWYIRKYYLPNFKNTDNYIAFEIKDDRPNRRYYKIGKEKFYKELENTIINLLKINKKVAILSHDGSNSFYNFIKNRIKIPIFYNNTVNEEKIINNFKKISTIICTAGHTQMISHSLNIKTISLITHPKLKYFCEDINDNKYIEVNNEINFSKKLLKMIET